MSESENEISLIIKHFLSTNNVILLVIGVFLIYIFIDLALVNISNGKAMNKIKLQRKGFAEVFIASTTLMILITISNWRFNSFTLALLVFLGLIFIYWLGIRYPFIVAKPQGVYVNNKFISYERMLTVSVTGGDVTFELTNGSYVSCKLQNSVDKELLRAILVENGIRCYT